MTQVPDPAARRPFWREPLVHFLAIGGLLFALDVLRSDPQPEDADPPIVVTADFVRSLRAELGRDVANEDEIRNAIDRFVEEEALVREARRLGLDRSDLVVRRRLVQKMEFLLGDLAVGREPTDAELQTWLDAHSDRYRRPARVTFEHVWFSRDRRGERTDDDARAALAAGVPDGAGDPFLPGAAFERVTRGEVARQLGKTFAERVFRTPAGSWTGPLPSAYGHHLVRVTAVEPGREATLDEVRKGVRRDVRAERRAEAERIARRALRERYEVVVLDEAPARDGDG